jgi:hypothetical protein
MAMLPPDRALRRMVVDLAALHPGDVAAVLDLLDPSQRKTIETLLRQLSDFGFGEPIAQSSDGVAIDLSRLSPWLADRLGPEQQGIKMTVMARKALRDCVERLCPMPVPAAPEPKRRAALFGRLKSAFGAKAAA